MLECRLCQILSQMRLNACICMWQFDLMIFFHCKVRSAPGLSFCCYLLFAACPLRHSLSRGKKRSFHLSYVEVINAAFSLVVSDCIKYVGLVLKVCLGKTALSYRFDRWISSSHLFKRQFLMLM